MSAYKVIYECSLLRSVEHEDFEPRVSLLFVNRASYYAIYSLQDISKNKIRFENLAWFKIQ